MLMRHVHPTLQFTHMLPYGAILHENGVQFVVYSRSATAMRLLLYANVEDPEPEEIIEFNPNNDRWGDIWSIFVPGVSTGQLYHFQAEGPRDPEHGQWFDGQARLIDPYAKALAGNYLPSADGIIRPPKCVVRPSDIAPYRSGEAPNLSETTVAQRGTTKPLPRLS